MARNSGTIINCSETNFVAIILVLRSFYELQSIGILQVCTTQRGVLALLAEKKVKNLSQNKTSYEYILTELRFKQRGKIREYFLNLKLLSSEKWR